jgi:copper chaperone CopZ
VTMERLQVRVPDMYADHHVLRARAVLTALEGVQDVVASAAFQMVAVDYDPGRIDADAIKAALASAGYAVEDTDQRRVPVGPVTTRHGDPAWDRQGVRVNRTDLRDVKAAR